MKKPDHIKLDAAATQSLLDKLASCDLAADDRKLITGIVEFYIWLQWALVETKLSLHRLRLLFGFCKTEKRVHLTKTKDCDDSQDDPPSGGSAITQSAEMDTSVTPCESPDLLAETAPKTKGHGRLSHEAYSGATTVEHCHNTLRAGDKCPELCGGKLYNIKSQALICLTGQALVSATRHLLAKLRCNLCGTVFTADLPESVSRHKYAASVYAHLAIAKNYAGLPFYRIEGLQAMVGVPLPDATQWDLLKQLADDIHPVYLALEHLAAQGELIHHDDTRVRILSLMKENNSHAPPARTGMQTTGIVSKVGALMIYLFMSGRRHSGENMNKLLAGRGVDLAPVLRMADALSVNFTVAFKNTLSLCLTHGRRKFYEIYDYFPNECRIVIDTLAQIYHHDAITKQDDMTVGARLLYHQKHSAPLMTVLHQWLTCQLADKLVEPNSSLGSAMRYMLKHWQGLTCFLEIEGAPLDNNITERALKIVIRCRKNSLFYKTEQGARVGDVLTSIIHTCVMAKQNPVTYLISLQHNRAAMIKSPEKWLPWNYQVSLAELQVAA